MPACFYLFLKPVFSDISLIFACLLLFCFLFYGQMDDTTLDDPPASAGMQVILPLEEFAEDLDLRLGRANGNIYHRRPGVEGVHDGQVMIRLKKKRFIVVDYSIIPSEEDLQAAAMSPHIRCSPGAGKQKCVTPECTKVGIPVLLYDSDPIEPSSLYLRSGLCFSCQRNLNEKRRTQRKRGSDAASGSSVLFAVGPGSKKFKMNGNTVELHSEAIILNTPPLDGAKSHREGYSFHEIGLDLQSVVRVAASDTERLITVVSGTSDALAAAVAAVGENVDGDIHMNTTDELTNAAVDASTGMLVNGTDEATSLSASSEDIPALYDKAFNSLSKSIYLLSQWKQSWDSAIAVAHDTVGDHGLADAVASAAAVAAAGDGGHDQSNMVSLLLAADQRKGDEKHDGEVVAPSAEINVQSFEV
jgi:hypothetical protein